MRKGISKRHQLIVWERDAWTCQYCGNAVFFTPLLKILDGMNPNHGYYHKNGKKGAVLDTFQWRWASVDHIVPVTLGGLNELENYITACWKCNLLLNNSYKSKPKKQVLTKVNQEMGWDGFSGLYLKLGPKDDWHRLLSLSKGDLKSGN